LFTKEINTMTVEPNEMDQFSLRFQWTVSRAHETYGWNLCTLYVNRDKVARCNGGGYDMEGTVLGMWIAKRFPEHLRNKITTPMYGLTFHDPDFDPGKAVVPDTGETVEAREAAGESMGLERYQATYRASSPIPTPSHRIPRLDGACGKECMIDVLKAIGGNYQVIDFGTKQHCALVSVPRIAHHIKEDSIQAVGEHVSDTKQKTIERGENMGWTFTNGATKADIIDKLTSEVPRQPAVHWSIAEQKSVPSGYDFSSKTLHRSVHGDVLWTVEELVRYKEPEERTRSIGCYLLEVRGDGAGYKPMDESMHPYYYTCPLAYLDMVPEANSEWREKVRAHHAMNQQPSPERSPDQTREQFEIRSVPSTQKSDARSTGNEKTTQPLNQYVRFLTELRELLPEGRDHISIENDPYMRLVVERISGDMISLCHYGEQNGDLCRDPEVCFLVSRWNSGNDSSSRTIMEAKPVYFRNDYLGIEHCTVPDCFGAVTCRQTEQEDLDTFVSMWLRNIHDQGFFEIANDMNTAEQQAALEGQPPIEDSKAQNDNEPESDQIKEGEPDMSEHDQTAKQGETTSQDTTAKKPPEVEIELGKVRLSIWDKTMKKGEDCSHGTLSKEGEPHSTMHLQLPEDLDILEALVERAREEMQKLQAEQTLDQKPEVTRTR
jgi:hypothetical protein